MYRGSASRFIPAILVLIIVVIVVAALVSVGKTIFGGSSSTQPQSDPGRVALIDTSADHSVQMIVRGPLVADENYRYYQVTIDSSSRNMTVYAGYTGRLVNFKEYGNTSKAYEQFVYSLDKANMMNGTPLTGASNDIRGVCATGNLYQFEVLQDSNTVKSLWTSSCRGSSGSLQASESQLQNLFLSQIPDSKTLLGNVDLGNRNSLY